MRLSKLVTLLLAGFLTFGSLNSVAATKNAKPKSSLIAKKAVKAKKFAKKSVKHTARKAHNVKKKSLSDKHKHAARHHYQSGVASYYSDKFNGRRTANGETFNNSAMTAAHRSLPFGTLVEVKNMRNGRTVVVRINDRGPYANTHKRVIDLSKSAARQLGIHHSGVANVKLAIVTKQKRATNVAEEEDI